MKDFKRVDFDPLPSDLTIREKAEEETRRDLQKPIEQLLCDVHEEIMNQTRTTDQNLVHAYRRMLRNGACGSLERAYQQDIACSYLGSYHIHGCIGYPDYCDVG